MNNEKENGEQAYPAAWGNPEQGGDYVPGMSLRDYFAANAPDELLQFNNPEDAAAFVGRELPAYDDVQANVELSMALLAKARFMYADAMLKERNK